MFVGELSKFAIFFLDVRGMPQEVSVSIKKGVETKSYEGVSIENGSVPQT